MAAGEAELSALTAGEREVLKLVARQVLMAVSAPYAARAHELFPGNGLICYWLIMATYSLSGADMAKKEYFRLKDDMTQRKSNI